MSETFAETAPRILHRLTETLAAARTEAATVDAALTAIRSALRAVTATILLVDADTTPLTVRAPQGLGVNPLWPAGPVRPGTPVGDVLTRREALLVEQRPDTGATDPSPEPDARGAPAVTALLPLLLDTRVLGVVILDFGGPHHVTPEEVRWLTTVTTQIALAFDRAALIDRLDGQGAQRQLRSRTAELEAERAASRAFVTFAEAASHTQTVDELGQLAMSTLGAILPGVTAVVYARADSAWMPLSWSAALPADLLAVLQRGLPLDTPIMAQTAATRQPVFLNGWTEEEQGVAHTAQYHSVAVFPVVQQGTVTAVLSAALPTEAPWTDAQRGLVLALGRSFTLLYDRLAAAQKAQQERDEAEMRTQALEAFAVLSRDLSGETDRYALVRRAQEIMLSLLTPGYALYWEQAADHWSLKSQVGDIGNPDLQRLVDEHGLPLDAPALQSTWQTGRPKYQDNYAQGADTPADMIRHVHAATAFRVSVYGQPVGMLAIGLFDQRVWTPVDRAVLETAIYSLGLVLERAQGVEELARSNSELRLANQELEAFAYSASHDLRTPVRHVKGFTDLAVKALKQQQLDKVTRHLEIVSQAAERMTTMIDAMLVLSRMGRATLEVRPLQLLSVVEQAQQDAQLEFPEADPTWDVGVLPTVPADPGTLQQVMTNLLSNALKFADPGRPLTVRIWAEERERDWAVFVQDTGVGFDQAYAGKLFGAFQRLHTQHEFAGTGVGVATVKRIVARHGGQVSADGQEGQGATFGFTLPKTPLRRAE
ncbi:GAF domain-containing protein [Deinococcus sedimenti]|uniref:histidine kinase n=1 Tax=Deinococcus sedimenti TaxID=1867090 RepID=A0ABQ2S982_9DEIO|nr:GAF domain-containing protein [Deinococcus sedimenti]GGS10584.1 hypothetical protein GCM10008960_40790 [Deinococcus sedimenti]